MRAIKLKLPKAKQLPANNASWVKCKWLGRSSKSSHLQEVQLPGGEIIEVGKKAFGQVGTGEGD